MKKFIASVSVLLLSVPLFARLSVICDVIYEKSFAEWSEYYRREVEFVSGQELGRILDGNKLFAIIWYSQTQCSVIQMEYNGVIVPSRIDLSFIDTYLGFDMLNEGRLGVEKNGNDERKWRIYGKDDFSLMIDPVFEKYPYNQYNNNIREQINRGIVNRRQRPPEEAQYKGWDKGIIVWHYDTCYIIQTRTGFLVALRNSFSYWGGREDDGDLVMGHFRYKGKTAIDNIAKGQTGMNAEVVFIASEYKTCADWVIENVKSE